MVQAYLTMVGRRHDDDDIVQEGNDSTGQSVRWSFSDITQDSFPWTGGWSADHGATWRLRVEFIANRAAPCPSD